MAEATNNLTKNQKLALVGLAIFAVSIFFLWGFNLKQQIKGPFMPKNLAGENQAATAGTVEEKQKSQDTDSDGLSDWDELNLYGTSPYLADSDSDGILDGAEIKNGTNPNCPEGTNCGAAITAPAASETAASGVPDVSAGAGSPDATNILSGQSDAASLRQALISAGVDQKQLEAISDEALMKAYQGMIASSTK